MFAYALPLSGLAYRASSGLDMTAEFAPLIIGIVGGGLFILGLAVATAIHDTWWTQRKAKKAAAKPAPLPKAA